MAKKIDVSSREGVQQPKRSKLQLDDSKKKLKLVVVGTIVAETKVTSCRKGVIEIEACSSDGG